MVTCPFARRCSVFIPKGRAISLTSEIMHCTLVHPYAASHCACGPSALLCHMNHSSNVITWRGSSGTGDEEGDGSGDAHGVCCGAFGAITRPIARPICSKRLAGGTVVMIASNSGGDGGGDGSGADGRSTQ